MSGTVLDSRNIALKNSGNKKSKTINLCIRFNEIQLLQATTMCVLAYLLSSCQMV